jgi:mannosyltransferase OCH1-like enzyme
VIAIPKEMTHIWIGPKPAPYHWMNTWKEKHPDWKYFVFDNKELEKTKFKNQELIDIYCNRKAYHGAADIIRYELLYERGGYIPGADYKCLHNVEELLECDEAVKNVAYLIYENEIKRPGLLAPVIASTPYHPFLEKILEKISKIDLNNVSSEVWSTVGNLLMKEVRESYEGNDLVIFPSYFLVPRHYTGIEYKGPGKIYAEHQWGQTNNLY